MSSYLVARDESDRKALKSTTKAMTAFKRLGSASRRPRTTMGAMRYKAVMMVKMARVHVWSLSGEVRRMSESLDLRFSLCSAFVFVVSKHVREARFLESALYRYGGRVH